MLVLIRTQTLFGYDKFANELSQFHIVCAEDMVVHHHALQKASTYCK
jgi:hypothetical protein